MALERQFVNYDLGCGGQLVIDETKLTIALIGATGDPELGDYDFEVGAESFEELATIYRERVVPYFEKFNCFDIDRTCDLALARDLREELGEENAVQAVAAHAMVGGGPLDALVANTCALLRRSINAAAGSTDLELHSVVFFTDEEAISVMLNVPSLEGKSNTQLAALLGDESWLDGELAEAGGWSLEVSPMSGLEAIEPYGDPTNFYERWFAQLLVLACALIEEEPALRSNVTITENFRVLVAGSEEASVDQKLRAAAKRHTRSRQRSTSRLRGRADVSNRPSLADFGVSADHCSRAGR